MPFPGVSIDVQNGNLLRSMNVADSVPGLIATAADAGNLNTVRQVYSLTDAESKGYTEEKEPFLHKLINEFYTELGGNTLLYVLGVAETMTMTDVVTSTNTTGLVKLMNESAGAVNLVAIARKPESGYEAGDKFLDTDVEAAVLASSTLCKSLQGKNTPVRLFIEGRVANEGTANDFSPNTANNGYAAVVLGGTAPDGSAAVTVALGRACAYAAHIKLGSGQNGALTLSQVYVGTKTYEERADMETLHDAGFLTFMHRSGAAGYYFGVDNMCSSDDYSILVHGRVIDKAQRIVAAAYLPFIEDNIRVQDDGTLNETDTKYLEDVLTQSVRANMGEQISGISVAIDTNQDIINTHTLEVEAAVLPLGYLTWIKVKLGLTTKLS